MYFTCAGFYSTNFQRLKHANETNSQASIRFAESWIGGAVAAATTAAATTAAATTAAATTAAATTAAATTSAATTSAATTSAATTAAATTAAATTAAPNATSLHSYLYSQLHSYARFDAVFQITSWAAARRMGLADSISLYRYY
jgi:hypothetical protein